MIARIWQGKTSAENYETYSSFMESRAIPDYQGTEGFIKLCFLRNIEGNIANFTLITFWEDMNTIKNFAGEDVKKAKYYPEDEDFLLEFEKEVTHFEVFAD